MRIVYHQRADAENSNFPYSDLIGVLLKHKKKEEKRKFPRKSRRKNGLQKAKECREYLKLKVL